MARYIDADALYKSTEKRIAEANAYRMAVVDGEFLDLINDAFTEDVAPKSEVEKLQEVIFKKEDLMQKIAKERNNYFDEVECLRSLNSRLEKEMGRKEEKIQELIKQIDKVEVDTALEVAREIFEEADKIFMATCLSLETYKAWCELKKKYTEEQ